MPKLEGVYNEETAFPILTHKTQLELLLETIKLINNVDIDILFNSYKLLIESCIHYEKYYKIGNNHKNFIDFVFDNFIDSEKGFNFDFYNFFDGPKVNMDNVTYFHKQNYIIFKEIIKRKREYYYEKFYQSIFDYNQIEKFKEFDIFEDDFGMKFTINPNQNEYN